MQKLAGTLFIKPISGRKGVFNVGELKTDIGEFKINDARLDQFDEGALIGEFIVTRIYLKSKPWRNTIYTDLMCDIAPEGYLLAETSSAEPPAPPCEDVLEDTQAAEPKVKANQIAVYSKETVDSPQESAELDIYEGNVLDLFGVELAPLVLQKSAIIKLDATVGRETLKEQTTFLKSIGYKWQFKTQDWMLGESA